MSSWDGPPGDRGRAFGIFERYGHTVGENARVTTLSRRGYPTGEGTHLDVSPSRWLSTKAEAMSR